jgi:hypothetical protein
MNRRGILALLGGAAAMPAVGVKAAASGLGLETALVAGSGVPELVAGGAPPSNGWWGSPLQIAFDVKERVGYKMERGDAYPHMKSWGRGFRQMAVERDEMILAVYRRKMENDAAFYEKVMAAFGASNA